VPVVSALLIGIFAGLLLRLGLSQTISTKARRWTTSKSYRDFSLS
jgi:hypothetical protein